MANFSRANAAPAVEQIRGRTIFEIADDRVAMAANWTRS